MKQITTLLILSTAFFLVGCATTDEVVFDNTKRPPKQHVEVFKDGKRPTRDFKEIADLIFSGERHEELEALRHFIARGKALGADAIIVQPGVVAGTKSDGDIFGRDSKVIWVFKAKAVAFAP